jgi:HEAT repeat protein
MEAASALGRWEDPRALPELERMSKKLFENSDVKGIAADSADKIRQGLAEDRRREAQFRKSLGLDK